ncbi:hypothetical protein KUTeg_005037 [Tegillarca granosa]|uniref:phosphopyruvate hydratase n=1 Tax=Tegillarca granosa TaxID=220873 RepID=A0ABQ9FIK9_TEGGR|nr:hypothetical protein KUTeg_005037 [Tegillarca granosa]
MGISARKVPNYTKLIYVILEVKNEFQIPLPMVTILQSGRPAPGKLNCVKEFMVVPKPGMPVEQSLQYIHQIYKYVANSFFTKSGVTAKLVNDLGALCPTFDRPEQGLDLLQEAITHLGLSPGDDFHIALNCASNEIFDYDTSTVAAKEQAPFPGQDMHKEKGKYEIISGQPKVPEDVTEFWAELLSRYPSVIALIDPLRQQAVGLNAKFVKFGAPVRGERIALYNRLIQIEEQLKQQGKLVVHKEHLFPHISPPPLPEPEDGAEVVEDSLPVKNVPKKK